MGENENKIKYSPEELQEIDRIVKYLSQETAANLPDAIPVHHEETEQDSAVQTGIRERYEGIPDDMGFEPEDITEEPAGEESLAGFAEEEQPEEESMEEPAEEEFQDITGLIQEIGEAPEEEASELMEDALAGISFPEETEEAPSGREIEEEGFPESLEPGDIGTPGEATKELSEEFDLSSIAADIEKHQVDEISGIEEEQEIPAVKTVKTAEEEMEPLAETDTFSELESSLDDLSFEEEIPSAKPAGQEPEDKAFDMDVEGLTSPGPAAEESAAIDDLSGLDIDLEMPDFGETTAPKAPKKEAIGTEFEDIDQLEEIGKEAKPEKAGDFTAADIEPLEDIAVPGEIPAQPEEIDLSEAELKKLYKAIRFFHPNIIKNIKDIILNDLLPARDIRDLVGMLLGGKPEKDVKAYLEKKLNRKIDISAKAISGRRVIAARAEYTAEGRERQARMLKFSGAFIVSALIVCLITVFSYYKIYIPFMAKKNIDEGVQLIKRPGVPVLQKQKDYTKAEEIFKRVDEEYIKDYLYGYHSYAKAYFQKKEYDYALEKLNKAYDIDASNIDTLNNLGFFYSKIPDSKFEEIKPHLNKYYYNKIKPVGRVDRQIDVAIDFYRKALNVDPENITAMYGIGNAYTNQGEYLKAKQYYENILAVDKESVVGYSGLLNLYIERDAMPEILQIYSDLSYKKKLPELPSALLAKLASYYLSKVRTDDMNIRIDYAVQSGSIKDFEDNPYPAVEGTLQALAARDMDYPPLFLQYARMSKSQKNYNLMKRNLLTALKKEPDYFAAHVLMAEYHYRMNDMAEAYKSCKNAQKSYLTPPAFTEEDFYYETEKIGTAYAIMGNIFYYYDKTNFRFGDEFEDEGSDEKSEDLSGLAIAQEKYEKAIAEDYSSPEVFYNLGRIYYIKGQYEKANSTWLNLYDDFTAQPELMFALGNSFYHLNNLEAGKGEYLKIISEFERRADSIKEVYPSRTEHVRIFKTLSAAYNNLGAVYQIQNSESKSNISYWKSIDYAKKLDQENEFARVNLARAFKSGKRSALPILDENISDRIEDYQDFK